MSIIPIICHNYMANSRRLREKDNNSYNKNTNRVYGDRTIIVSELSTNGFSSINEYRKSYHDISKQINERGGFKI